MRNRILTPREKIILERYIAEGIKEKGFRLLKFRIKRNLVKLKEEIELAEKIISK